MGAAGHPNRRALLAGSVAGATVALAGCSSTSAGTAGSSASPGARPTTPATAFARLMDGNGRWVSGRLQHPDRDPDRRQFVAQEQEPFGAVLSGIGTAQVWIDPQREAVALTLPVTNPAQAGKASLHVFALTLQPSPARARRAG
ncbi:hypothetical protein ACU639_01870 [Streptomyces cynarae]|uniref:hypothetical protein n=1 Tax=Streptomyces cynarae TaxID=2981134 RepID=UPI00406CE67C